MKIISHFPLLNYLIKLSHGIIEKKKNTNSYVGNILLLKKLKGYSINQDGNLLKISIIDRNNKKRILHLKLKKNK